MVTRQGTDIGQLLSEALTNMIDEAASIIHKPNCAEFRLRFSWRFSKLSKPLEQVLSVMLVMGFLNSFIRWCSSGMVGPKAPLPVFYRLLASVGGEALAGGSPPRPARL